MRLAQKLLGVTPSHLSGFLNRCQDALDKDSSGGVPGLPKVLVFGKGGHLVGCGIVWEAVLETNICEEELWGRLSGFAAVPLDELSKRKKKEIPVPGRSFAPSVWPQG